MIVLAGFRWILENRLAGSGRPGLLGPFEEDVAFIRRSGFGLMVTLTEQPSPAIEGISPLHFPIDDMGIPTPRLCEAACRTIVAAIEDGTRVLLHCRAGMGRTGLMAACVLITLGSSAEAALAEVRRINPGYIQSAAQERFVSHYERHLRSQAASASASRATDVRPDPDYYAAIGGDEAVKRILTRFYDRVFVDPVLAPHFEKSDKATIIGKQFGFMKRCFTGDRQSYMGQRPRNAHHWMVISDAEFDHREDLMREALVEEGLTVEQARRWIAVEEVFRRQIVKDKPWPLFYRGLETFWSDQPKETRIEVDTVCDGCTRELRAGDSLWLAEDKAVCGDCAGGPNAQPLEADRPTPENISRTGA